MPIGGLTRMTLLAIVAAALMASPCLAYPGESNSAGDAAPTTPPTPPTPPSLPRHEIELARGYDALDLILLAVGVEQEKAQGNWGPITANLVAATRRYIPEPPPPPPAQEDLSPVEVVPIVGDLGPGVDEVL